MNLAPTFTITTLGSAGRIEFLSIDIGLLDVTVASPCYLVGGQHGVEQGEHACIQAQRLGGQIFSLMRRVTGTRDRDDIRPLASQPCQRKLRRGASPCCMAISSKDASSDRL